METSALTPAARLALAVVWVLGSQLPTWALLMWIARSSRAWRVAANSPWLRLLATIYATVGTGFSLWAAGVLLLRDSMADQRIVMVVWTAQLGLLTAAVVWVKRRRGGGRWLPPTQVPPTRRPPLWPLVFIVVFWNALTAAWVVVRFTPVSAAPPSPREWAALASSVLVIGALVWLLLVNVRAARRGATDDRHNVTAR